MNGRAQSIPQPSAAVAEKGAVLCNRPALDRLPSFLSCGGENLFSVNNFAPCPSRRRCVSVWPQRVRHISKVFRLPCEIKQKQSGHQPQSPKIQNGKLTAHCSIPFHLKAAIRSNPWARQPRESQLELRFLTQTLRGGACPLSRLQRQLVSKSTTEPLPSNKEELQISKGESCKERSLLSLPESRAARRVPCMLAAIQGVNNPELLQIHFEK